MRYSSEFITIQGLRTEQVNINKAKRLFNEGRTIFLHPANMRVNNVWQNPMPIKKTDDMHIGCEDIANAFHCVVSEFTYYNCDSERGKYPIFFAEII